MISRILANTPMWVWGILLALLWLGFTQSRTRDAGLRRILILPLIMTALALGGLVSNFGVDPRGLSVWAGAMTALAWLVQRQQVPAHTRYDAVSARFHIPGSWVPMAIILGIFSVKYIAGVMLAMQPALANVPGFALSISLLYGAMSGIFVGRSTRLWKLAKYPATTLVAPEKPRTARS